MYIHPPVRLLLSRLLLLLFLFAPAAHADEVLKRQALVGAKLFPAVLAAYEGLNAESLQEVHVLLLHDSDEALARDIATTLQGVQSIAGLPVRLSIAHYRQLETFDPSPPQGILLVEPLPRTLEQVIAFSLRNGVISFSPFRGDVERGILAGMQISDQVLPYINSRTLSQLPYSLKPFFLRVAIRYEP